MKHTMVHSSVLSFLLLQVFFITSVNSKVKTTTSRSVEGEILERCYHKRERDQWVTEFFSDPPTSKLTEPSKEQLKDALKMLSNWVNDQRSDASISGSTEQSNFGIRLDRQGLFTHNDGTEFINFQVQVGKKSLAQCNSQKELGLFDAARAAREIEKCLGYSLKRNSRVWITRKPTRSNCLHQQV